MMPAVSSDRLDRFLADPVAVISEELILPTGQPYGKCWGSFQETFFRAIFARLPDGRPRHRLAYGERRRGESKTEDIAAAALADLLTGPARHRSYVVAGDEDQAALVLDSIAGFKARSPILADVVVLRNVVRNVATDAEVRVLSSDARTNYGIRPRRVYFDELSLQTDERLWTTMWSAIGKDPRSQMVAVSMAGFDFSSIGWKVRELASSTPGYYFTSRQSSELAPWLSAKDLEEQRATLHPADFARFWECRWTEPKGSWITAEMYDAAVTGQEVQGLLAPAHVSVGFVDVGLVHDPTAIAVAHRDGERIIVDTLRTLQGSRSEPVELEVLEDLVVDLTAAYHVRAWTFEAPQAVASVQRLQNRLSGASVVARYPTVETQARLFGQLYELFANHKLVLFPHEQLKREAMNLVTRVTGGRIKVVDSSSIHQDHVIAVGGAADMLLSWITWKAGDAERFSELLTSLRSSRNLSAGGIAEVLRIPGVPDLGIDRTMRS
jgi:hypothetical protein